MTSGALWIESSSLLTETPEVPASKAWKDCLACYEDLRIPPPVARLVCRIGVCHATICMKDVVKELVARDRKRKVQIYRREDGSFGFEARRFSEEPRELCWIPYGRFSECFAADLQTAEFEARGRVDWLRGQMDDS